MAYWKIVFGSRGICDYYVRIPGKFMIEIYACGSDEEIPATFELMYEEGGVVVILGAAGAVESTAGYSLPSSRTQLLLVLPEVKKSMPTSIQMKLVSTLLLITSLKILVTS